MYDFCLFPQMKPKQIDLYSIKPCGFSWWKVYQNGNIIGKVPYYSFAHDLIKTSVNNSYSLRDYAIIGY